MEGDCRRNIPLLYLYSVLIKRVTMPVIILYFLLHQLSYTQIGILAAAGSILAFLTEVHGGIFADMHGKKPSLILHAVFGMLTMLLYYVGDSFWWFLAASVSYGIAGAFITGTRGALLYDTLATSGETKQFKRYNGRMTFYSHIFNAGILLAIPVLYEIDVKLPFLAGILFFLAAALVAAFFAEPPIQRSTAGVNGRLGAALREILASRKGSLFLLLLMVTVGFWIALSQFIQPMLLIAGIDVIYFGIVYALMRALMGLGAELAHRLELSQAAETAIGVVGLGASILLYALGQGLLIAVAPLLANLAQGFNRIVFEQGLNDAIASTHRTTILSISSLADSLANSALVFLFGIAADAWGVQRMYWLALALFIAAIAAIAGWWRSQRAAA